MEQMTPFLPEGVDAGATNTASGHPETVPSGNDGSGQLGASAAMAAIEALAALLEPEAFDPDVKAVPEWREPTKQVAVSHAARAISAGYRRVVDDDTTVERVARALWRSDIADVPVSDTDANWAIASANGSYQSKARAAVRALREDTP